MSSFFTKKSVDVDPNQVKSYSPGSFATGGKIDEMVLSMVQSSYDDNGMVRSSLGKALVDIGKKQPNLVIATCMDFIIANEKGIQLQHRIQLLNTIEKVLELKRDQIAPELAVRLLNLAMAEMTSESKEVVPEWQGASSAILVSLGMRFPDEIIKELLSKFQPGIIPHYFIIKTLGDFAVANPLDTVPKMKEIFARILPVLGSVKLENMKWVFASTIGNFCDAVTTYVANIDRGSNKSIHSYSFSSDVFPAYEILFNNWLQAKEAKVRLITIQALGCMCACLERDLFEINLVKLIPAILNTYKKEKDQLPVTQGLNVVLDVCVKDGSRVLDPQLNVILNNIFPLAIVFPDQNSAASVKNYNELLRCFQTLGLVFSDEIATFILEKLNTKDPKIKIGGLAILKHLVTRLVKDFADKKGLLVTGIKPLILSERDLRIRKELAQVIIAMAAQDYLSHEGGETLVEFIVQNASITDEEIAKFEKPKDKEAAATAVSPEELRFLCDNILNLSATTIDAMHPVLYPYLLETVVNPKYTSGLGTITKSISHIAEIKRSTEAPDYYIDFDRAVNLPKPQAIIARLFVIINSPLRRGNWGLNGLLALKAIGPILHPSICDMWDSAIPKLVQYLESNAEGPNWNVSAWEDLILRLLAETIKMVNDDDWTAGYANQLASQLENYNADHDLKRIAFKHLGLTLQKLNHKDTVRSKIDLMLASADSNQELQRLGCAQGLGYCSVTHLDMVLEKLQGPPKAQKQEKSGGGFLGMFGGSKSNETAPGELSNTVILAYGYIAAYSQPALITSRIDVSIINQLKPVMPKVKSNVTKECIIKTIELIGKAMHPSHLKREYVLKQRDELLKQILTYISPASQKGAEKTTSEVTDQILLNGLVALSTLINLEPTLSPELEREALDKVASFYSVTKDSKAQQSLIENMNSAFASVLCSDPSIDCLCRIFTSVEPFVRSVDLSQRERSTNTVLYLLKKLAEVKVSDLENEKREKSFVACGGTIAMLLPRVTDVTPIIRQNAVQAIQIALYVDHVLKSNLNEAPRMDQILVLAPFTDFRKRIETDDVNDQFSIVHEMARELSKLVTPEELPDLLISLLKGLNDPQVTSTSGACVMLNGLVKARGAELLPKVPQIITGITKAMETIVTDQTMNGTLHAVRSFAQHHELPIVSELLKSPIPHQNHVVKCLHAIAKDDKLVLPLFEHLFDIITNTQLFDEMVDPKTKQSTTSPSHLSMSATCAISELLQLDELEDFANENYPKFFAYLTLRVGTSNTGTPEATEQAVNALQKFFLCAKDEPVQQYMSKDNSWGKLSRSNEYHRGIRDVSFAVCKVHPEHMQSICELLIPYLKANYLGQKVVVSSVFAQFIEHSGGNKKLLDFLVNRLLGSLVDYPIKFHCLTGLGNIASLSNEDANKYAPTVLDALLSSIDDRDDNIAQEAMNGLAKVFKMADDARVSPILVNICHRIRPAFDKDNDQIRSASFNLFGALHKFGDGAAAEAFYDQLHSNLPAIVLHLNDPNDQVRKSCKEAFRILAPLYRSPPMQEYLESSLQEGKYFQYNEFLNDLSKILVDNYLDRINYNVMTCVDYFKSNWNEIKVNASAYLGFILHNLPQEKRKSANLTPSLVSKALIQLLKEKDPEVRKATAESISLLYSY
eukprot:TRINITY_DN4276_c0_g1_i1.p1 TRINITY_DN4276_c0_g1~~TRINITY_DN4276_c0_g1_i1.p1  ORF type:complete len:1650 (+),score=410.28 TRINITY_DN4276_c0_g1_i1:183-5132(+)